MNWLRKFLARRRQRRYERWFGNMRERKVVFTAPKEDHRNWSDEYMRSLRK